MYQLNTPTSGRNWCPTTRNSSWSRVMPTYNMHIYISVYVYLLKVDPPTSGRNCCPATRGGPWSRVMPIYNMHIYIICMYMYCRWIPRRVTGIGVP